MQHPVQTAGAGARGRTETGLCVQDRLAHTLLFGFISGPCWAKGFTFLFCFQVGESHERALSKEKSSQSKAVDLESQLGMSRAELSQLRRNKEDVSFVRFFFHIK